MSWSRVTLVLLLVPILLASAAAVQPLDNDAGTGRDAGDTHTEAVMIGEGRYTGRLTAGVDETDYYALELEQGTLLRVAVSHSALVVLLQGSSAGSELEPYTPILTYGVSLPFLSPDIVIPFTGTWYLAVKDQVALPAVAPYAFEVTLAQRAWSETFFVEGAVMGVTLEWDEATHVTQSRMTDVLHDRYVPGGSAMFQQNTYVLPNGTRRTEAPFGTGVRVATTGDLSSTDPLLPHQLERYTRDGYSFFIVGGGGEKIALRHVAFATDAGARHTFAVAADMAPNRIVVQTGDEYLVIEAGAAHSGTALSTPVGRVTTDTSVAFDVTERLYGIGAIARDQRLGSTATLTSPSGAIASERFVADHEPGTWRLDVDRSVGVATETAYPYFIGIELPDV